MSELSLVAVLMVREGTEDEMRGALAALVPPSRKGHGNLRYELYADRAAPRRFVIVERWTDEAAHVKHDNAQTISTPAAHGQAGHCGWSPANRDVTESCPGLGKRED